MQNDRCSGTFAITGIYPRALCARWENVYASLGELKQYLPAIVLLDNTIAGRYYYFFIKNDFGSKKLIDSFKCKETKKIWDRKFSKKFPPEIQGRARRKLIAISISESINDLKIPPSNYLEALEALEDDRIGQYSIRINGQWRICFEWKDGNAFNVEIVDYH